MFRFENPQYLYLMAGIIVLAVIHYLSLYSKKRRLKEYGDPDLLKQLFVGVSRWRPEVKFWLCQLALASFIIALARPQFGTRMEKQERQGIEALIVLDVSNSMMAEDVKPNRLEKAKMMISNMVENMKDDKVGLVVFAGQAFNQLPITSDYVSAKMFLNSISTESIPIQGTAIGDAISTAVRGFSAQSEHSRAIIVITDGENHEDDAVAAAKQAAEAGIKVYTIGVGSADGQPIPMNGELLKDKDGNIVVTRLDEETLRKVASAGGGAYVHAGNDEFGLTPIISDIRKMEDEEYNSVVFEEYNEQFMYFLGIALVFFVLEMLVGDRRARRHLFEGKR